MPRPNKSPIANIAQGIALLEPAQIHEWCKDDPEFTVKLMKELSALIKAVAEHTHAPAAPDDLPLDIKAAITREIGALNHEA
jgi:hypothetical protein